MNCREWVASGVSDRRVTLSVPSPFSMTVASVVRVRQEIRSVETSTTKVRSAVFASRRKLKVRNPPAVPTTGKPDRDRRVGSSPSAYLIRFGTPSPLAMSLETPEARR